MKFSVLLSVYYKENPKYLKQSLDSIFCQTYLPSEVILIKDGTLTPDLEDITKYYTTQHTELKIISLLENKGLGEALNIGLEHCSFDIVARMDTDDIIMPNRFEHQINYMKEHPDVDILGSFAIKIDEFGNKSELMKVPVNNSDIYKYIWTCPFIHPTVVFRKSKIEKIGSYNPNAGPRQDDYDLWFRCAINGLKFANIPEPLLYYRFFSDSLKKNNVNVAWHRFKVGFRGCRKLKSSPIAYIGIIIPLVRSILPYPLNKWFQILMNKLNPRHKNRGTIGIIQENSQA